MIEIRQSTEKKTTFKDLLVGDVFTREDDEIQSVFIKAESKLLKPGQNSNSGGIVDVINAFCLDNNCFVFISDYVFVKHHNAVLTLS